MKSGILYPTIELGGVSYELRISREILLYRLSAKGISMINLRGPKSFATLFDVLYAIVQDRYLGTVEELVSLVHEEQKVSAVDVAVAEVIKKVFPQPTPPANADGQLDQVQ